MAEEYKPLFNRTYLNLLVLGSALAIFMLTYSTKDETAFFDVGHYPDSSLYTLEYDTDRQQLDILLPTPAALSDNDRLLQQLLLHILEARSQALGLQPDQEIASSRYQDRLELHLSWPAGQPLPDLSKMIRQLDQTVTWQDWQSLLERLKAKQYLQGQDLESRLQARFFALISDNPNSDPLQQLNHRYRQMFEQPRFVLSGPELEPYTEQLTAALNYPPRTALSHTQQPALKSQLSEAAQDRRYHQALGMQIPPRDSSDFARHRISAQVIQDLLSQQAAGIGLEYRIRWAALADGGYQLLLLHSDSAIAPKLQRLQQLLTPEQIEQSRQRLITRWMEHMALPQQQAEALRSIAFYRLPGDSLQQYVSQLQAPSTEQLLELARQGLQPGRQISILVPPTQTR